MASDDEDLAYLLRNYGSPGRGGLAAAGEPPSAGAGLDYGRVVDREANAAGVPPAILRGIGAVESGLNPRAPDNPGSSAQGPFQITKATRDRFGVTEGRDPLQSAKGAAAYFRFLLDHYGGDTRRAVQAYHDGEGAIPTQGEYPTDYADKVMAAAGQGAAAPTAGQPRSQDDDDFSRLMALLPLWPGRRPSLVSPERAPRDLDVYGGPGGIGMAPGMGRGVAPTAGLPPSQVMLPPPLPSPLPSPFQPSIPQATAEETATGQASTQHPMWHVSPVDPAEAERNLAWAGQPGPTMEAAGYPTGPLQPAPPLPATPTEELPQVFAQSFVRGAGTGIPGVVGSAGKLLQATQAASLQPLGRGLMGAARGLERVIQEPPGAVPEVGALAHLVGFIGGAAGFTINPVLGAIQATGIGQYIGKKILGGYAAEIGEQALAHNYTANLYYGLSERQAAARAYALSEIAKFGEAGAPRYLASIAAQHGANGFILGVMATVPTGEESPEQYATRALVTGSEDAATFAFYSLSAGVLARAFDVAFGRGAPAAYVPLLQQILRKSKTGEPMTQYEWNVYEWAMNLAKERGFDVGFAPREAAVKPQPGGLPAGGISQDLRQRLRLPPGRQPGLLAQQATPEPAATSPWGPQGTPLEPEAWPGADRPFDRTQLHNWKPWISDGEIQSVDHPEQLVEVAKARMAAYREAEIARLFAKYGRMVATPEEYQVAQTGLNDPTAPKALIMKMIEDRLSQYAPTLRALAVGATPPQELANLPMEFPPGQGYPAPPAAAPQPPYQPPFAGQPQIGPRPEEPAPEAPPAPLQPEPRREPEPMPAVAAPTLAQEAPEQRERRELRHVQDFRQAAKLKGQQIAQRILSGEAPINEEGFLNLATEDQVHWIERLDRRKYAEEGPILRADGSTQSVGEIVAQETQKALMEARTDRQFHEAAGQLEKLLAEETQGQAPAPKQARERGPAEKRFSTWLDNLQFTHYDLHDILTRAGVLDIDSLREFDPELPEQLRQSGDFGRITKKGGTPLDEAAQIVSEQNPRIQTDEDVARAVTKYLESGGHAGRKQRVKATTWGPGYKEDPVIRSVAGEGSERPAADLKKGQEFATLDGRFWTVSGKDDKGVSLSGYDFEGKDIVVNVPLDEIVPFAYDASAGGISGMRQRGMAAPEANEFDKAKPELKQLLYRTGSYFIIKGKHSLDDLTGAMVGRFGQAVKKYVPGLYEDLIKVPGIAARIHGPAPEEKPHVPEIEHERPAGEPGPVPPGRPGAVTGQPGETGAGLPAPGQAVPPGAGPAAEPGGGPPEVAAPKPEEPGFQGRLVREGGIATLHADWLPKLPEGFAEAAFPKDELDRYEKVLGYRPLPHQADDAVRIYLAHVGLANAGLKVKRAGQDDFEGIYRLVHAIYGTGFERAGLMTGILRDGARYVREVWDKEPAREFHVIESGLRTHMAAAVGEIQASHFFPLLEFIGWRSRLLEGPGVEGLGSAADIPIEPFRMVYQDSKEHLRERKAVALRSLVFSVLRGEARDSIDDLSKKYPELQRGLEIMGGLQEAGANLAWQREGHAMLLSDGTGTGKTTAVGMYLDRFGFRDKPAARVIYVTNNQDLRRQVTDTVLKPLGMSARDYAQDNDRFVPGKRQVNFMTYAKLQEMFTGKLDPVSGRRVSQMNKAEDFQPDIVILDESQALKNWMNGVPTASAGEMLSHIAPKTRAIFMSATPFESVLHTGYLSALGLWYPHGDWASHIQERYDISWDQATKNWRGLSPKKLKAMSTDLYRRGMLVKNDIDYHSMKNKAGKALTMEVNFNMVKLTNEDHAEFGRIEDAFEQLLMDPEIASDGRARRVIAGIRYMVIRAFDESRKVETAINLGRQYRKQGRFPVITTFRKGDTDFAEWRKRSYKPWSPMPKIIDALEAAGVNIKSPVTRLTEAFPQFAVITGDKPSGGPARKIDLERVRKNKVNGLIMTMRAGGTGIDAHDRFGDKPRVEINLSAPDTAMEMTQVQGRHFRAGSQSDALTHWLFIDRESERKLARKVATANRSMGALVHGMEENATADEMEEFEFPELENATGIEEDEPDVSPLSPPRAAPEQRGERLGRAPQPTPRAATTSREPVAYGFSPGIHVPVNIAGTLTQIKARHAMIAAAYKALGVMHLQGRLSLPRTKAMAHYTAQADVVRDRLYASVEVASHELGHRLDKMIFGTTPTGRLGSATKPEVRRYQSELLKIASTPLAGQSPLPEGFAEFIRLYVTDPAKAKALAPGFHDYFEKLINPTPVRPTRLEAVFGGPQAEQKAVQYGIDTELLKIRDVLLGLRSDFQDHLNATPEARIRSTIESATLAGGRPRKHMTGRQVIEATLDDQYVVRYFFNKLLEMSTVQHLPAELDGRILGDMVANRMVKAEHFLFAGTFRFGLPGVIDGEPLVNIAQDMGKAWGDFEVYAKARRALDLNKERGWDPYEKVGIHLEDAQAAYAKLHSPDFNKLFHRVQRYGRSLTRYLVDAGMMTPQAHEAMVKANPDWSPLWRMFDPQEDWSDVPAGSPWRAIFSPLVSIKGSDRPTIPIVEALAKMTMLVHDRVEKNESKKAFVRMADLLGQSFARVEGQRTPEGAGFIVERVPPERWPTVLTVKEAIDKINASVDPRHKIDVVQAGMSEKDLASLLTIFRPSWRPPSKPYDWVWINGKRAYVRFNPELYDALMHTDARTAAFIANWLRATNPVIRHLGEVSIGITRLLRLTAVAWSPRWWLRGTLRHLGSVPFRTESVPRFLWNYMPALWQAFTKGPMYWKLRAAGQGFSTFGGFRDEELTAAMLDELERAKLQPGIQRLLGNIARGGFRAMVHVSNALDSAGRIAEGNVAGMKKAAGRSQMLYAGYRAGQVPQNYRKAGSFIRGWSSMVAFLTAQIGGYTAFGESMLGAMKIKTSRGGLNRPQPPAGPPRPPGAPPPPGWRPGPGPAAGKPEEPGGPSVARGWMRMALAMSAVYLYYLSQRKDKRWQEHDQNDKARAFVVYGPEGQPPVRLPKPYVFGEAMSVFESALQAWDKGDPASFEETAAALYHGSPVDIWTYAPDIILPGAEAAMNWDTYFQRPIHPERGDPEYQVWPYTSESAKAASRMLSHATGGHLRIAPPTIEHVLGGYTAGLSDTGFRFSDYLARKLGAKIPRHPTQGADFPVLGSFLGRQGLLTSAQTREFYDAYKDAKAAEETFRKLRISNPAEAKRYREENEARLRAYPLLQAYDKRMSVLTGLYYRIVQDPRMDAETKRTKQNALAEQVHALATKAVGAVGHVRARETAHGAHPPVQ